MWIASHHIASHIKLNAHLVEKEKTLVWATVDNNDGNSRLLCEYGFERCAYIKQIWITIQKIKWAHTAYRLNTQPDQFKVIAIRRMQLQTKSLYIFTSETISFIHSFYLFLSISLSLSLSISHAFCSLSLSIRSDVDLVWYWMSFCVLIRHIVGNMIRMNIHSITWNTIWPLAQFHSKLRRCAVQCEQAWTCVTIILFTKTQCHLECARSFADNNFICALVQQYFVPFSAIFFLVFPYLPLALLLKNSFIIRFIMRLRKLYKKIELVN